MEQEMGACRTLTVPQAAEILGISRNAAYEAVARGEIPAIRFGKRLVVPIAAFDRLLEQAYKDELTVSNRK